MDAEGRKNGEGSVSDGAKWSKNDAGAEDPLFEARNIKKGNFTEAIQLQIRWETVKYLLPSH